MKLPPSILTKVTTRLFGGRYHYKVVLRTPLASWFRQKSFKKKDKRIPSFVKDNDAAYAAELYKTLENADDYSLRVEYPLVTVYTNSPQLISDIVDINHDHIKYVSIPEDNANLSTNTVLVKRIPHRYRVIIGQTHQHYNSFLAWCETSNKIRISNRAIRMLARDHSTQSKYFYVTDDAALTMVKIFFGNAISKIESVVQR